MKRLLPILALVATTFTAAAMTFEEWRLAKFTVEERNDSAISGEAADPDGDERNNLLEFVLNTDPKTPDRSPLWSAGLDTGGHLTLHFPRWKSHAGVLYAAQVSGDLTRPWKSRPLDLEQTAVVSYDANMDLVSVRDLSASGAAGRRFIRLLAATDADDDGLPDEWEFAAFHDIESQDAAGDFDLDTLSNLLEWQGGTDPTDFYNGALPVLSIVSGDAQVIAPDAYAAAPLVVEVRKAGGALLHHAPVSFTLTQGPGWISAPDDDTPHSMLDLTTDAAGRVAVRFHSAVTGGATRIEASAQTDGQIIARTFTEKTVTRAERPEAFQYTVLEGGDVQFTWLDYSDDETGFVLEVSNDRGGSWQPLGVAGENGQALVVVGFNPPAGTVFRIAALNVAGRSGHTLDAAYGSADDDEDGLSNQDEEDEGTGKDDEDSDDDSMLDGEDGAPLDADFSPKRLPKRPFVVIDLTQAGLTSLDVPVEINDRGRVLGYRQQFVWWVGGQEFFWFGGMPVLFPWESTYFGGVAQGRLSNLDTVLCPYPVSPDPSNDYFRVWNLELGFTDLPVNATGYGRTFGPPLLFPVGMADDGVIAGHTISFLDDEPGPGVEYTRTRYGTLATPPADFGNTPAWYLDFHHETSATTGEDRLPHHMNRRHDLVGSTANWADSRPFAYVDGQFYDLPGWSYAGAAWFINDPLPAQNLPWPTIVGERLWVKGSTGWLAKEMRGVPSALNDRLEMVGDFTSAYGVASYYRNAQWLDLSTRRLSGGAWQIAPADINNHGLIAGTAVRKDDQDKVRKPVLLLPVDIVPDFNRDGNINNEDRGKVTATEPWRFWINDDDDTSEADVDDEVEAPTQDAADEEVKTKRDLLDFFPLYLDIKELLKVCPPTSTDYFLKQDDSAVNVILCEDLEADSDDTAYNAGSYLRDDYRAGTFIQVAMPAGGNLTSQHVGRLTLDGRKIDPAWLQRALNEEHKKTMLLVEGNKETNKDMVLEVRKGTQVLAQIKFLLSIKRVKTMYRWINLRHHVGESESDATDVSEPLNWPDKLCSNKIFTFVHGYSVSEKQARDWNAEMFKRMYWSGSKAKFVGVTWRGNQGQLVGFLPKIGGATPDYWINVKNAFLTSGHLKNELTAISGTKYVAAHSLGNMVVSSAMVDHGLSVGRYFMIDAAVAREAYDSSTVDNNRMSEPSWRSIAPSLWSPYFYSLFSTGDARRNLTWTGRFQGISNVYQFYSSGENVLETNPDGAKPTLTGDVYAGRRAWIAQEMNKGTATKVMVKLLSGTFQIDPWGQNARAGWDTSGDPQPTTQQDKIEHPYFEKFSSLNGVTMHQNIAAGAAPAANYDFLSRLLGEEIPALSWPAGSTPVNTFGTSKSDLMGLWAEGGPPERPFAADGTTRRWFHSDMKEISYLYTHRLFEKFVTIGSLK